MGVKNMDLEEHPASCFAVVPHQDLNKLHIVFGHVIPQEAPNHYSEAVPRCFLRPNKLLGELFALHHLYLWSDKNIGFHICFRELREENSKVLEVCRLLI